MGVAAMKVLQVTVGILAMIALGLGSAQAREKADRVTRPVRSWSPEQFAGQRAAAPEYLTEAAVDTYTIINFTFESLNWQGWTRLDMTAQADTFWHVEDYLEPELAGLPGPLEGTKSAWCGAPPGPWDYMCRWSKPPGYGNLWKQWLVTDPVPTTGLVTFSYHGYFDSEPGYDYTYVEYYAGGGNWQTLASYTGTHNVVGVHHIPVTTANTKLRFRFVSDGAWSNEDGLYKSKGAAHVDSITIADAHGVVNFENFESAPDRAKRSGVWHAERDPGFGKYSGLRTNLTDKDPCGENFSTQVVFFVGSPYPSSQYPGLYETPFCKGTTTHDAPCQFEFVVSPVIDMTRYSTGNNEIQDAAIPAGELPKLGGTFLRFTAYMDLPLPNLVFFRWHVRSVPSGCAGGWMGGDYYYDPSGVYEYRTNSLYWINPNNPIQIALGVEDMCSVWYLSNGNCADHTPAPYVDNVKVQRFGTYGPQWSYGDRDLFQDNFPVRATPPWGTVRADAANDLRANNVPSIDPGDSIVVTCTSPLGGGIDTMPNSRPAVYMHVQARWIGAGAPPPALGSVIHGAQLQGSVGLWQSTDAGGWDVIQADFARVGGWAFPVLFMVDLNDSLFVPGYMIEYYFTARDNIGQETALPNWARSTEPYFEFTCLPTGNGTTLFVDDFHARGSWNGVVDDVWRTVFNAVLPASEQPDRYDVNDPTSGVSNGLGSRANAALLRYAYHGIVWDSGDLQDLTICDGTVNSDKSNDCQLLVDWMSQAEHACGLWVCGDDIAYDLTVNELLSTPARTLMQTWCGVALVNMSYFDLTGGRVGGGVVYPRVTGDPAGLFFHGGTPDHFFLDGGCWTLNMFDCLGTMGSGVHALDYPDYQGTHYYAGVQSDNVNSKGQHARTMWFGFSMMYTRDESAQEAPIDRFEIARDVLSWMIGGTNPDITGAETPGVWKLAQNFPNPFNPVTTIGYSMKEKGVVTVKIYNVAGQLVRTLVDGVKDAGSYKAVWDGKNNGGFKAASGIYFYKMKTAGFSATKKMVLLR
jgi:hypothetical protein